MTEGGNNTESCVCCECKEPSNEETALLPEQCHCGVCKCEENGAGQAEISAKIDNCKCVGCVCMDFVENKTEIEPVAAPAEECKCKSLGQAVSAANAKNEACTCGNCICPDCENIPLAKDAECHCALCNCAICELKGGETFQLPEREQCTCNQCTCAHCENKNKAGAGAASAADDVAPFQPPERLQCMCEVCTCAVCEKEMVATNASCGCKGKGRKRGENADQGGDASEAVSKAAFGAPNEAAKAGIITCSCMNCICVDCQGVKAGDIQNRPKGGTSYQPQKFHYSVLPNAENILFTPDNHLPCFCVPLKVSRELSTALNIRPSTVPVPSERLQLTTLHHEKVGYRSSDDFYASCCLCAVASSASAVDINKRKDKIDQLRSFLYSIPGLGAMPEKVTRKDSSLKGNHKEYSRKDKTHDKHKTGHHKKEQCKPCKCGRVHATPDNKMVDLSAFQIVDIKRLTEHSILIAWIRPRSDLITGYDILVNNEKKLEITDSDRTYAVVHSIDHSKQSRVSIYARTKCGKCKPPAVAMYIV